MNANSFVVRQLSKLHTVVTACLGIGCCDLISHIVGSVQDIPEFLSDELGYSVPDVVITRVSYLCNAKRRNYSDVYKVHSNESND